MGDLRVLTRREASIFACLTDTVVAPEPILPPVRETDAVAFFDEWLSLLPGPNRAGMRALLWVAELAPLAQGFRARLRRLDRATRTRWLKGVEHAPFTQLRLVTKLVVSAAQLSYYGNDAVLGRLGYDADANLERGRRLRAAEGRP
ncbi:MAG TPA: hypothetical protein VJT75_01340 [Thermoleophilaceae bacterium]|nr:hypothetical protein [Thermoleophilaceae bacterium]